MEDTLRFIAGLGLFGLGGALGYLSTVLILNVFAGKKYGVVVRIERPYPIRAPKLTDKNRHLLEGLLRTLNSEDMDIAKKIIDAESARLHKPNNPRVMLWMLEDDEERLRWFEQYLDAVQGLHDLANTEYYKYSDNPSCQILWVRPFYCVASEKDMYLATDNT
ncbi:hypothetical protein [Methylosoma difficile]